MAKSVAEYLSNLTLAYGGIHKMLRIAHRMVQPESSSILKAFVKGSGHAADPHMAMALKAVLIHKGSAVSKAKLMTTLALTARDGLHLTLASMGLSPVAKAQHDGFSWTTPVETWTELFPELHATVASYLQNSAGQHAEEVANLLVNAADYNNPETMQTVSRQLRDSVEELNVRQANMIARTETARVYGSTALTAMQRNGVPSRRWLTIASGHAGGVRSSSMRGLDARGKGGKGEVCDDCLGNSVQGWVPINEPFKSGDMAPPIHPWDRCDIAGNYQNWLPPADGAWPYESDLYDDLDPSDEELPAGFLPLSLFDGQDDEDDLPDDDSGL